MPVCLPEWLIFSSSHFPEWLDFSTTVSSDHHTTRSISFSESTLSAAVNAADLPGVPGLGAPPLPARGVGGEAAAAPCGKVGKSLANGA